jgi:hypothetical protein
MLQQFLNVNFQNKFQAEINAATSIHQNAYYRIYSNITRTFSRKIQVKNVGAKYMRGFWETKNFQKNS